MKAKTEHKTVTLMDMIATQLSESNEVSTYSLGDGSGSGIEIKKRNAGKEFVITLEFDAKGYAMTGVSVYAGDVVESVEHQRVI